MNTQFSIQMLSSANQANLEAMRAMTVSMLQAAQRVTALNLDATRSAIEYATNGASLLQGDSWSDMLSHSESQLRPATEKTVAYFRGVQDISAEAQGEITQALATRAGEVTDTMISILDNLEQSAPAPAAPAVAAVKSAIANAHSAYDNMLKTGRKVAEANAIAVAKATSALGAHAPARSKKAA